MKTQGTELYFVDPTGPTITEVGCITSIDGIDTSIEQIDVTCLQDNFRSYQAGLAAPGAASFGIYLDPNDASHVRLHELKVAGTTLEWAVGFSDNTGVPPTSVDSIGEFVLPTTRSWITFAGYMNSFPFSFQQNSAVQSAIGIQVSGEPALIPAV
jgi:hypothetical protein